MFMVGTAKVLLGLFFIDIDIDIGVRESVSCDSASDSTLATGAKTRLPGSITESGVTEATMLTLGSKTALNEPRGVMTISGNLRAHVPMQ